MTEHNFNNQVPVIRFFDKHKWRILVPVLFIFLYFGLPNYFDNMVANQPYIFIKSSNLSQDRLNKEVVDTSNRILSDDFMRNLVSKYDLYADEREKGIDETLLLGKMRKSIDIRPETDNLADGTMVVLWVHFRNQNPQKVLDITSDIAAKYEENQNFQVMKYVTPSYDANPYKNLVLVGNVFQALVMFSIPLILIWEIPFLFYSDKTKKMVFEPIKSDWQSELFEAKLRKQTWKIISINIHYSVVFLNALWQKSPIGDLIEFARKIAG